MTNTMRKNLPAGAISCVWIETGNPKQPLACFWIDEKLSVLKPVQDAGVKTDGEGKPLCA